MSDWTIQEAKSDIDRAVALNRELPETQLALGYYHYVGRRKYAAARLHPRPAD